MVRDRGVDSVVVTPLGGFAACLAAVLLAGCGRSRTVTDPLAAIAAELDAAVVAAAEDGGKGVECIRGFLGDDRPAVRSMAAQAAAAAGDWDSMPKLITLLQDADSGVRARASSACAVLLGMDYGHDPNGPAADQAKGREAIARTYEAMRQSPPPQYRK